MVPLLLWAQRTAHFDLGCGSWRLDCAMCSVEFMGGGQAKGVGCPTTVQLEWCTCIDGGAWVHSDPDADRGPRRVHVYTAVPNEALPRLEVIWQQRLWGRRMFYWRRMSLCPVRRLASI